MSLYNMEEVCKGCVSAVWHECCHGSPTFCHCEDNQELYVDHLRGECDAKELKEEK